MALIPKKLSEKMTTLLKKNIYLLACFVSFFGIFNMVSAQMPTIGGQDVISTTVTPAHPRPGDKVTIQIESYSSDLNKADISWFLDSTVKKQGIGQKTFSFNMGNAGSVSTVTILAKTSDGQNLQKIMTFRPSSVDLIWEAVSYAPPFYEGKTLFPYQGVVKVVAMPEMVNEAGNELSPDTLTYKWTKDGTVAGNASGYGKNIYYLNGRVPLQPSVIGVEVSSSDGLFFANGSVTITPIAPMVRLYENDPEDGILFNNIINSQFVLKNEEVKISAIPYFFDAASKNDDNIKYDWVMNDNPAGSAGNGSDIIFRQPGNTYGTASISLQVSNNDQNKIFQFGDTSASILFSGFAKASGFTNTAGGQ